MYELDKARFGSFVAQLRKEKGLTQKALAQQLFISDKAVSKWETGVSVPDTALLIPLAEALGVTVTELLQCCRQPVDVPLQPEAVEQVVKTAVLYGEEKPRRAWRTMGRWPLWYGLSLVLGVLVTAVGVSAARPVLTLVNTPASCMEDAVLYTRLYFCGSLASMVYNMGSGILRAMGDSRRPTGFLIAACFTNIILDLVCVVGLNMGVAGAAVATVASQVVSALLVIFSLLRLPEDIRLRPSRIRLDGRLLRRILYVGVPAGLQFITFDLSNLLVQSGINSFGDTTVAAWTAYIKTDALTWMISGAFGVSITTFVGQNFGAQKYDRIRRGVWVCMGMSVSLVGLLSVLVISFRHIILGIYTTDPEVIALGAFVMTLTVPFNFLFMPVEVFAGTMRGTGYSVIPTAITCVCVCLFRVVWVFTVVRQFHRIELLAICYPLSWLLASTVFYIAYLRGSWLRRRIAQCGMDPEVR